MLFELTSLLNSLELMKKVSEVLLCLTKVQSHRSHMYLAEDSVLHILFEKVTMYDVRLFVLNNTFLLYRLDVVLTLKKC